MKKTINGRRYDTDAPRTQHVDRIEEGIGTDALSYWREDLYRTGHGRWFVVGRGGPLTPYGGRSEVVRELDAELARAWLQKAGSILALAMFFTARGS